MKVTETLKISTPEPEGQYNRMIINFNNKYYEVSGHPFCFAGYDIGTIRKKCIVEVEKFLQEQVKK